MAKGKKTGGRDFPKGHKFGGNKKKPPELKIMKKDNILEYVRLITDMSNKNIKELELIAKDKEQNIVKAYVASSMLKSYAKGEPTRFEILADRALGKIPQTIKNEIEDKTDLSKYSTDKLRKALEILEGKK